MREKASMRLSESLDNVWIKSASFVVVSSLAFRGLVSFDDVRLTATTLVALSGTLTGFVVAGISMLVSAADRPFMAKIRRTGHYQTLVSDLVTSAALWLAVIAVALAAHFTTGLLQKVILALATGIMLLSLIQFLKSGTRFTRVIEQLSRL